MSEDNSKSEDFWDEDEDTMKDQYLTFVVGEETFGFGIEYVTEIVGMQPITTVPDMQDYVKGVINLRGSVIPVIDIRLRFGLEEREYGERTCIVVVKMGELSVGLIVDIVHEVTDIPESKISEPPKVYGGAGAQYISGMGKLDDKVVILLDITKLLSLKDQDAISALK